MKKLMVILPAIAITGSTFAQTTYAKQTPARSAKKETTVIAKQMLSTPAKKETPAIAKTAPTKLSTKKSFIKRKLKLKLLLLQRRSNFKIKELRYLISNPTSAAGLFYGLKLNKI